MLGFEDGLKDKVGDELGIKDKVGDELGINDGTIDGRFDGIVVGFKVGIDVGLKLGFVDESSDGEWLGLFEGYDDNEGKFDGADDRVGTLVGEYVGNMKCPQELLQALRITELLQYFACLSFLFFFCVSVIHLHRTTFPLHCN